MRTPPAQDVSGGADERLPTRRPALEPPTGREALVEHLVDRLAHVEGDLRATRATVSNTEAQRSLLAAAARQLAEHEGGPVADLARLALPLLGDWCILETITGDCAERRVISIDPDREVAAAALEGPFRLDDPSLALCCVTAGGRAQRRARLALPDALDGVAVSAADALGDGPVLLVPVHAHGRLVAAMAFGRAEEEHDYARWEQQLAGDFAGFVAIAMEQRRAIRAADEAARTKSEFLTMMSHELRTPLNAIAGYAQLLEMGFRGPLNEGQGEAVNRILRGQEHLLELVDGVLTFSRLTSGRLALDVSEVEAATLLALASDPLAPEFAEREIRLIVSPCGGDVNVFADRERAPQVLRQLLQNALKFTEPGGEVRVACEQGEHMVRFVVTDTGRGIPPAQREAIFQPFVQAEKGYARSADGSGLGLSIGRELAVRMGGTLSVSSEVGVGSRFVFTLPRADAVRRPPAAEGPDSIDTTSGPG